MEEYEEILEIAGNTYSYNQNFDQMVEECSELITKLMHYKKGRCNKADVLEEMVDVSIMLWLFSNGKYFVGNTYEESEMMLKKCQKMKMQIDNAKKEKDLNRYVIK